MRHSQQTNDPHVPVFIITNKEGTVVSAHCVGCMAGLCECCSHVASVLFCIEVWTRLLGKLACTQVKCTWILPTYVKQVDYARAEDMNFTSVRKMKADLDKSIENLDDNSLPSPLSSSTPKVLKAKPTVQKPSQEDLQLYLDH